MRRKSERVKDKSSDKKAEKSPKKTRTRSTRRRKKSSTTSPESSDAEDFDPSFAVSRSKKESLKAAASAVTPDVTEVVAERSSGRTRRASKKQTAAEEVEQQAKAEKAGRQAEGSPDEVTATKEEGSDPKHKEKEGKSSVWQVKSADDSSGSEIKKLKLCIVRPPEPELSPRKRKKLSRSSHRETDEENDESVDRDSSGDRRRSRRSLRNASDDSQSPEKPTSGPSARSKLGESSEDGQRTQDSLDEIVSVSVDVKDDQTNVGDAEGASANLGEVQKASDPLEIEPQPEEESRSSPVEDEGADSSDSESKVETSQPVDPFDALNSKKEDAVSVQKDTSDVKPAPEETVFVSCDSTVELAKPDIVESVLKQSSEDVTSVNSRVVCDSSIEIRQSEDIPVPVKTSLKTEESSKKVAEMHDSSKEKSVSRDSSEERTIVAAKISRETSVTRDSSEEKDNSVKSPEDDATDSSEDEVIATKSSEEKKSVRDSSEDRPADRKKGQLDSSEEKNSAKPHEESLNKEDSAEETSQTLDRSSKSKLPSKSPEKLVSCDSVEEKREPTRKSEERLNSSRDSVEERHKSSPDSVEERHKSTRNSEERIKLSRLSVEEKHKISRDSEEKHKSSLNSEERHKPSRDSEEKHKTSLNSEERHKSSRDSEEKHKSSVNSEERHKPSRDSEEKHKSSLNSEERHKSLRDSEEKHKSSVNSEEKHKSSRDSEERHKLSRDSEERHKSSVNSEERHKSSRDVEERHKISRGVEERRKLSRDSEERRNSRRRHESPTHKHRHVNHDLDKPAAVESPKKREVRPREKISLKRTVSRASPDIGKPDDSAEPKANCVPRKRRWGSSAKKPVFSITSDSLKNLIPEAKPLAISEVELTEEEKEEGEVEREEEVEVEVVEKKQREVKLVFPATTDKKPEETKVVGQQRTISLSGLTGDSPSPPRHRPSSVLFINNLTRPFTVNQLKELLERTGSIVPDGFWTNTIRSKCYVQYSSESEAQETRRALHGVRWPVSNPKQLSVDFARLEDLTLAREINEPAGPRKMQPPQVEATKPAKVVPVPVTSVREWDLGKPDPGLLEERDRERAREKERVRPVREQRKERSHRSPSLKDVPPRKMKKEEDAPAKLLDDLFRKTKLTPCIYWLPLTAEQIVVKEEMRRKHMAEHQRRMEEIEKAEKERRERMQGRGRVNDRRRFRRRSHSVSPKK